MPSIGIPDPLAHSLPWLDVIRKAFPAVRYLTTKRQVKRRINEREALKAMRRGGVLAAQLCPLHGLPQDTSILQPQSPLWCGCVWHRDVIYGPRGTAQRIIRVGRRDPVTGTWLVASWADTGAAPAEEVLEQARMALELRSRAA